MTDHSDEHQLSELRKSNHSVLAMVYKTHFPMILNLVITNSGTEQEAKDIYQEAVIHFYERLQHVEFVMTCKIKTYLYAVCRRLWLKRLAEKKKIVRIGEDETFRLPDDVVSDIERTEVNFHNMDRALSALGEPCRTLIEDFYLRSCSMGDITNKFGYTNADNAKNQKYKCLQRLKRLFFDSTKQNPL